jgi:hypothetical protein
MFMANMGWAESLSCVCFSSMSSAQDNPLANVAYFEGVRMLPSQSNPQDRKRLVGAGAGEAGMRSIRFNWKDMFLSSYEENPWKFPETLVQVL